MQGTAIKIFISLRYLDKGVRSDNAKSDILPTDDTHKVRSGKGHVIELEVDVITSREVCKRTLIQIADDEIRHTSGGGTVSGNRVIEYNGQTLKRIIAEVASRLKSLESTPSELVHHDDRIRSFIGKLGHCFGNRAKRGSRYSNSRDSRASGYSRLRATHSSPPRTKLYSRLSVLPATTTVC